MAFANLNDIAGLAEAMLKYVFKAVLEERADDMKFFAERVDKDAVSRLERFIEADFAQVDYTDAVTILETAAGSLKTRFTGASISLLSMRRYLAEEHFKAPVVVKNYPKDIKAFYMRLNEDGKTVAAMDVLAPGIGEIIGGSQREERLDVLDERMLEMGLNKEDYWWYRDLRRYGTVPHSGFGLGFERLIAYVTGVQNVRDVIPFPRTPAQRQLLIFFPQRASACWLFFYPFCQVICLLSQAIYLQPRHNDHPVTEYYIATFTHKNNPHSYCGLVFLS